MKEFKCRGTLGDSYIVCCVIRNMAKKQPMLIHQCWDYSGNAVDDWEPLIREIYSLLPKVRVQFCDRDTFDKLDLPRLWPSISKAEKMDMCPMTPHPAFNFPITSHELPPSYVALSPKGGKTNESSREMGQGEVVGVIEGNPNSTFVIVGNSFNLPHFRTENVISLAGKTSVLEAMGVVARAKAFVGVQGLMAYIALSSRVNSFVYTKSSGYDKAFRERLMPEWENYCTVVKSRREEDWESYRRFVRSMKRQCKQQNNG